MSLLGKLDLSAVPLHEPIIMGTLLVLHADINVVLSEGAADGCSVMAGLFKIDIWYPVRNSDQQMRVEKNCAKGKHVYISG